MVARKPKSRGRPGVKGARGQKIINVVMAVSTTISSFIGWGVHTTAEALQAALHTRELENPKSTGRSVDPTLDDPDLIEQLAGRVAELATGGKHEFPMRDWTKLVAEIRRTTTRQEAVELLGQSDPVLSKSPLVEGARKLLNP
jgi:hypothetical protein